MPRFEIHGRDGASAARTGTLRLQHGEVRTPAFVPLATKGVVKTLEVAEVGELGYEMVLGNTFHLFLTPGHERVAEFGGLHEFMRWDGPIITDSGGVQVFSMGHGTVADEIKGRPTGERAGVILAVEPHVLQIVDRPDRTRWLLEQVGSPALKVNFDISHFDVLGIPTEESVQALVPDGRSVHTHVKDQRGRSPEHEFLIPGEGDFDYVRYLTAMQAAGYTGYIVPEISLMVQRRPDYDPLAACTQSYVVLDRAFQAAGIARPVAGRT